MNTNDEAKNSHSESAPPWPITVVCVAGFLFCMPALFYATVLLFYESPNARQIMTFLAFIFILIFEIPGLIGFWRMRWWGLFSYGIGSMGGMVFSYLLKWPPRFYEPVLLGILITTGLFYYKRMR